MHLRIVKARSGNEIREYAQLVQSYRRSDGMTAHKVLGNLGQLSLLEVENLRRALQASRQNRSVPAPRATGEPAGVRVWRNLQYLDIAVVLSLWESWRLPELWNRLLPPKRTELVGAAPIIAALVIQRCVSPGSKLFAQRWYPRTALPELLGVSPAQFNNGRIHRVLDQLSEVDERLQEALTARCEQRNGRFKALFVDLTDTWFEGRGSDLAEPDRTKEGLYRQKIGILLLCNEIGLPVRWRVLAGKTRDPQALKRFVGEIEQLPWARDIPIVFDRAMGGMSAVTRLIDSGLQFLTAVRRPEIPSYTDKIPSIGLDIVPGDPAASEEERKDQRERAAAVVVASQMSLTKRGTYVLDLGVTACRLRFRLPSLDDVGECLSPGELQGGAYWLSVARGYQARLDAGEFRNRSDLAAALGVTRARMTQVFNLLRLDVGVQDDLLAGRFGIVPERMLRLLVSKSTSGAGQRQVLADHASRARPAGDVPLRRHRTGVCDVDLRLVGYFNPEMLVEQRATAARHLGEFRDFIETLNERLAADPGRRSETDVLVDVTAKLSSRSLVSAFDVCVHRDPSSGALRVEATVNEENWWRRRAFDGFLLFVAHPALLQSAEDIVQLYFDKDAVEKDFQTIKSAVKLRPMFHHTDPKVRAHVTLCMLALFLERSLEDRLRRSAHPMSAPACFEELASTHLNIIRAEDVAEPLYSLSETTPEQRAVLRSLRMARLGEQEEVVANLTPTER